MFLVSTALVMMSVMKMARPFFKKHRHIFFDDFFTSTKLMEDLLAQDTYACGTV